jgi:hypothetical protein
MDVLTNKQRRTDYDAPSRYTPFYYYYNTKDKKYVYGLTSHILNNAEYVAYNVMPSDTLDSLALRFYGRPDYFWVIADFNRIKDPFIKLQTYFKVIKIPNLGQIVFEVR